MRPIQLYAGFDQREAIGFHTFCASVLRHATVPVSITPLSAKMLGMPEGSNAFTFARFLVPYLQDFSGPAIFMDGSDMVCMSDIAKLASMFDPYYAVQVVKHAYKTKHPRKYIGTPMECENRDYERKNWASVMLMNCGHPAWKKYTPEYVRRGGLEMLQFAGIPYGSIGDLPIEWNWLADEHGENPGARLLHWTAGIPAFAHYTSAPHAKDWWKYQNRLWRLPLKVKDAA